MSLAVRLPSLTVTAIVAVDVIVRAQPGCSGRLRRCIPIGEFREQAYRVTRPTLEAWGEARALRLEEAEAVEGQYRSSPRGAHAVGADADPVHLPVEAVRPGFRAYAAHTDDSVEAPGSDLAHAVLDTETPLPIRISGVGSLVDQSAH